MSRITKQMLEARVDDLNRLTRTPSFQLSSLASGYALESVTSEAERVRSVFSRGYQSIQVLYDMIGAYIQALRDVRDGTVEVKQ